MNTSMVEEDRPAQPVQAKETRVGVNGALATALTKGIGSMTAVYIVIAIVALWITLGQLRFLPWRDQYPFPYLLFWDNVLQVALCSAILVGQSMLRQAADRRSEQTYEGAEATFAHVAALQVELDQQDRALGYGVALLADSLLPWIEEHRVRQPPLADEQWVGINGKIAAWLMRRLGSMVAVYVILAFQLAWIGLYFVGVQRFDPYPFAFMTFLSTLAQLIFMVVIMVGQGVNERAGDSRSQQTYFDTQATLHELERLRVRLATHGESVQRLTDYTASMLTRNLARAMHEGDWDELPETDKEASRAAARQIGDRLAAIGCLMVPANGPVSGFAFSDEEIQKLARPDRGRPITEREARSLPGVLARVDFRVERVDRRRYEGLGKPDFTAAEWRIVVRATMAAGTLVAISEGVIAPEERDALFHKLREASVTHPQRVIREIAAGCDFREWPPRGTRYEEYLVQARTQIEHASDIVAGKGEACHAHFRQLLIEITDVVANANREGGFFGLGARYRTPHELAAMEVVRKATEFRL